jgi:hypothetical protein
VILGLVGTWWAGRPQKPIPPRPTATPRLQPGGEPLHVGGIELQSPGLDGQVELHPPTGATLRTIAGMTDHTLEALAGHHLRPERVIEISDTAEHPAARTERAIDTHHGEPAFQIDLPRPPPGHGQVILASDESGTVTWHLPRLASGLVDTTTEWATRTYRLARWVAPRLEPPWMRSLVRAFGSKIITSLTFPLLDPLLGEVGERFARHWETSRRPYRLRTFTPDDYALAEAGEPDWDRLAGGRALLFVHGTFARAHTAFAGFTPDVIEDMHGLYEGRVFAFDHFTLSDDPRQNVAWFFEHLPPGLELQLDIVCHSRGGLVSRVLAERAEELGTTGSRVAVDKIVFAGTPNAGTVLAEPAYVGDLIDSYTNLLNFLPGQQAVDAFEGVITVVKQVAVGAVGGLAGLQSMRPGGPFLAWLNAPAGNPSRYFALAGDYVPLVQGWRHYAVDHLMDRVFDEPNDLVVPTAGTWDDNGSTHFPISLRHELRGAEGVNHTGYFASKQVRDQLLEWLQD